MVGMCRAQEGRQVLEVVSAEGLSHMDPGLRQLRGARARIIATVIALVKQLVQARCALKNISEDVALQQLRSVKNVRSSRLLRFARQDRASSVAVAGSWAAEAVGLVDAAAEANDASSAATGVASLQTLDALHTLRQVGKKREFSTDELADALVCARSGFGHSELADLPEAACCCVSLSPLLWLSALFIVLLCCSMASLRVCNAGTLYSHC
jgi:hypothetical protein